MRSKREEPYVAETPESGPERKKSLMKRFLEKRALVGALALAGIIEGDAPRESMLIEGEFQESAVLMKQDLDEKFGHYVAGPAFDISNPQPRLSVAEAEKSAESLVVESVPRENGEFAPEDIRRILATFPRGWIKGEISAIRFQEEPFTTSEGGEALATFSDAERGRIPADASHPDSQDNARKPKAIEKHEEAGGAVTFYGGVRKLGMWQFARALTHEVAHGNDPFTDATMSTRDRMELLLRLTGLLQGNGKFRSVYAERTTESINHKDNPQFENYRRVREYWAEISAAYFTDPKELTIEEFNVVDSIVHRHDFSYRCYMHDHENPSSSSTAFDDLADTLTDIAAEQQK